MRLKVARLSDQRGNEVMKFTDHPLLLFFFLLLLFLDSLCSPGAPGFGVARLWSRLIRLTLHFIAGQTFPDPPPFFSPKSERAEADTFTEKTHGSLRYIALSLTRKNAHIYTHIQLTATFIIFYYRYYFFIHTTKSDHLSIALFFLFFFSFFFFL